MKKIRKIIDKNQEHVRVISRVQDRTIYGETRDDLLNKNDERGRVLEMLREIKDMIERGMI